MDHGINQPLVDEDIYPLPPFFFDGWTRPLNPPVFTLLTSVVDIAMTCSMKTADQSMPVRTCPTQPGG